MYFLFQQAQNSILHFEIVKLHDNVALKSPLLFLIHLDKFQYSVKDVSGPLKKRLEEFVKNDGKSESEKVLEIYMIMWL